MSQWGAIYPAVQNFKNTEQYLIKECIKNCLIVMPFNNILIIFYIFGALYGVGDRVSGVIVYKKKIQETTIYPGKLMQTIPYRES